MQSKMLTVFPGTLRERGTSGLVGAPSKQPFIQLKATDYVRPLSHMSALFYSISNEREWGENRILVEGGGRRVWSAFAVEGDICRLERCQERDVYPLTLNPLQWELEAGPGARKIQI